LELGYVSALDSKGRTIWIVDAHRDAVIGLYDDTGSVIETHEHKGDFKKW
jgi:hypothetical protein